MKCPFCSQDNLVGAQFCDNCGASLKQGSQIQKYVAAARLEPAPSPTPIFPSRHKAAPTPAAPAYAAASTGGYASFTDSDSGRVFCLNSDKILLGRGPGQLDDGLKLDFEGLRGGATVSKRHALLRHDVTGVFIEDVGSGNGTFINGERLPQGIERGLNNGDRLRLGAVLLNFAILNHKK